MDENEEGQYLQFKNLSITPKKIIKYQDSKVNQKSIECRNVQKSKQVKDIYVTPQKNSNQSSSAVGSNKKNNSSNSKLNSPRSTCKIISFSTNATNKPQKQLNSTLQMSLQQNINLIPYQNSQHTPQHKLIKSKSNIQLIKTQPNCIKQTNFYNQQFSSSKQRIQKINNLEQQKQKYYSSKEGFYKLLQVLKSYETKIQYLQKEIQIKNKRIQFLETLNLQKTKKQTIKNQFLLQPYSKYEHEQNRQSIRRLLKMLKQTEQYHQFAQLSLDDNGITFLNLANNTHKTKLDLQKGGKISKKTQKLHLCTCFKEFIPQNYLWVSQSIYSFGKEFITSKLDPIQVHTGLSKSQYELLLYQLNKMWRERQKRIINTITHQKNLQIDKLKRKYNLYQNQNSCTSRTKIQKSN